MLKTVTPATKILVFEDKMPVAAMRAFLLRQAGCVMTTALSVEKAVWLAQTKTFETTPTA